MWIAIEIILVTILVIGALYPYVMYIITEKKVHGACYEAGVAYIEVLYQTCKHRFCDLVGTVGLLFLLCSFFEIFAVTLAVYSIHVMICGRIAIKYGHVPGSIEWR